MRWCTGILLILLIVLSTITARGQSKNSAVISYSFWHEINPSKTNGFKLPQLVTSDNDWHWRLYLRDGVVCYTIQVFKSADSIYSASIDLYTEEYTEELGEKPTYRVFGETAHLKPQKAAEIYTLIQLRQVNEIPTGNDINGWHTGFDGETYIIEFATGRSYSSKSYWSPDAIKNVKEAVIINNFIEEVSNIVDMKQLRDFFSIHIPFESFYNHGSMIGSKELTVQQKKKYRKERDTYQKKSHLD